MLETFAGTIFSNCREKYGIDIVSIMALVEMILSMIENCPQSEGQFVQSCNSPTYLQRALMNMRVRKELGVWGRSRVNAVAGEIFSRCADADDTQIAGAYQEAMGVLDPENEVVDYDFGD